MWIKLCKQILNMLIIAKNTMKKIVKKVLFPCQFLAHTFFIFFLAKRRPWITKFDPPINFLANTSQKSRLYLNFRSQNIQNSTRPAPQQIIAKSVFAFADRPSHNFNV